MSGFEFWSHEMNPGIAEITIDEEDVVLHLTQAVLMPEEDADEDDCSVISCTASGRTGVLCCLRPKTHENQVLDILLPGGDTIKMENKGSASVSLSGYIQPLVPMGADDSFEQVVEGENDPLVTREVTLDAPMEEASAPKKRRREQKDENVDTEETKEPPKKKKKKKKKSKKKRRKE